MMGRKLYFPVTGVPTGTKFKLDQGGTDATNAVDALTNLNGVTANKLNQANGLIQLNVNGKIDSNRIPPELIGTYLGPMVEGLTSLIVNQQSNYLITDYDEFMTYTLTAIAGVVSRVGNVITYTAPAVIGSSGFTLNNKTFNIPITTAAFVTQPDIISPASGATGQSNNILFTSEAFAVNTGSDTHEGSDWQIATDAGFTNIVQQVVNSSTDKTTWSATSLANNTTYYIRVRHKGTSYGYSTWSTVINITTAIVPTYAVVLTSGSIEEGEVVTFTINTANVADGTSLYWTVETVVDPNTATVGDFIPTGNGSVNGTVVITNNTGTFTVTTLADLLLEGVEVFDVFVRTTSVSGPVVASLNNSIVDSSYTATGTSSIAIYNTLDTAEKVDYTSDGKLIIAGISVNNDNDYVVTISKYNLPNANYQYSLDQTFGTDGKTQLPTSAVNVEWQIYTIKGLHVDRTTGKIYIVCNDSNSYVVIYRLNSNGTLDTSFNSVGYISYRYVSGTSKPTYCRDSEITTAGLIYLAIYTNTDPNTGHGKAISFNPVNLSFTAVKDYFSSGGQGSCNQVTIDSLGNVFTQADSSSGKISRLPLNMNSETAFENITTNIISDLSFYTAIDREHVILEGCPVSGPFNGGFLILSNLYNSGSYYSTNFKLLAVNGDLSQNTTFATNGTLNYVLDGGFNGLVLVNNLIVNETGIFVTGRFKANGTNVISFIAIGFKLNGDVMPGFGTNGVLITSINSSHDYNNHSVFTNNDELVLVGDTDIILSGAVGTRPHNKLGSIGTVLTEVGITRTYVPVPAP